MLQNIKDKVTHSKKDQGNDNPKQQFTIQPHPAKTNDPRDLEPPQPGAGLNNKPEIAAHHAHGPQIPNEAIVSNLEQPASREELKRRAEELNRQ
ncbi:hypothetical protein K439DRAFT_1340166 [Ramaria rubella]|nr:hypothetical protein K439DRAFT_1340166 [Ramaria rubella]